MNNVIGSPAVITIREFLPKDAPTILRLFADGQRQFAVGVEAEIESYVEKSLLDDLSDIEANYRDQDGSNFWVAEVDGQVRGMFSLQRRSEREGELRRLSVDIEYRRRGIAQTLLETAEAYAREQGYTSLRLSTITPLKPAIALYEKFGYREYGKDRYGAITVLHFTKNLVGERGSSGGGQS